MMMVVVGTERRWQWTNYMGIIAHEIPIRSVVVHFKDGGEFVREKNVNNGDSGANHDSSDTNSEHHPKTPPVSEGQRCALKRYSKRFAWQKHHIQRIGKQQQQSG